MLDLINRETRKTHKSIQIRKYTMRSLKIAAIAVLLLNMSLTIAAASSSSVRTKVIRFLIRINDSYMNIDFEDSSTDILIPESWTENYYPTYIPDGYALSSCSIDGGASMVEFSDTSGHKLSVGIYPTYSFSSLNTEDRLMRFTAQRYFSEPMLVDDIVSDSCVALMRRPETLRTLRDGCACTLSRRCAIRR